jgi:transcriptional regulator GlxA family with amidase domain
LSSVSGPEPGPLRVKQWPVLIGARAELTLSTSTQTPSLLPTAPGSAAPPDELIGRCAGADVDVLRRAVRFVDLTADRPIGITDIAAASGVGPRALQLAFRRYAGTTPWSYVRSVRLHRAHRDLQAADPGRDTVLAIALRWGFTNRSRFAAEYRAAYGETPAVTLRR